MDRSVLRARISKKFNDIHNKFEDRKGKVLCLNNLGHPCESEEWVIKSLESWLGTKDRILEGREEYEKIKEVVKKGRKQCKFLRKDLQNRQKQSLELAFKKMEYLKRVQEAKKLKKHNEFVMRTCYSIMHDIIHMSVIMSVIKEYYDGKLPIHRYNELMDVYLEDRIPLISLTNLSPCFNLRIQQHYNYFLNARIYWEEENEENLKESKITEDENHGNAVKKKEDILWSVFNGIFRHLHEWLYICKDFELSDDLRISVVGRPFSSTTECAKHLSENYNLKFVNILKCISDLLQLRPYNLPPEFKRFYDRLMNGEAIEEKLLSRYLLLLIQPNILTKSICIQKDESSEGYVLEDFPKTFSHFKYLKQEIESYLETKKLQKFESTILKKHANALEDEIKDDPEKDCSKLKDWIGGPFESKKEIFEKAMAPIEGFKVVKEDKLKFNIFNGVMNLNVPDDIVNNKIFCLKNNDPIYYLKTLSVYSYDTDWPKLKNALSKSALTFEIENAENQELRNKAGTSIDQLIKMSIAKKEIKRQEEQEKSEKIFEKKRTQELLNPEAEGEHLSDSTTNLFAKRGFEFLGEGIPFDMPKRGGWVVMANWWLMEECYTFNTKTFVADLRYFEDELLSCLSIARQNFRCFLERPTVIIASLVYYRKLIKKFIWTCSMDAEVRAEAHERIAEMRKRLWQIIEDVHNINLEERCSYINEKAWRYYGGTMVICYAALIENEVKKTKIVATLLKDAVLLCSKTDLDETIVKYGSILNEITEESNDDSLEKLEEIFNPFAFHRPQKDREKSGFNYIDKLVTEAIRVLEELPNSIGNSNPHKEKENENKQKKKLKSENSKKNKKLGSALQDAPSKDKSFENSCKKALDEEVERAKKKIVSVQKNYRRLMKNLERLLVESFNQFADWSYKQYLSQILGVNSCFEEAENLVETLQRMPDPELNYELCMTELVFDQLFSLVRELKYIAPEGIMTIESFYESLHSISLNDGLTSLVMDLLAPYQRECVSMEQDPLLDWRKMIWMGLGECGKFEKETLEIALNTFENFDQFSCGYLSKEQFLQAMPEVFLTEKEKFEGKVNKCMERLNEFIFELFSEHHCNDYPTLSYYPFLLNFCLDHDAREGLKKALIFYRQKIKFCCEGEIEYKITADELKKTLYPFPISKTSGRRFQKSTCVKSQKEKLIDGMLEEIKDDEGNINWKTLSNHHIFKALVKNNYSYYSTSFDFLNCHPLCLKQEMSLSYKY